MFRFSSRLWRCLTDLYVDSDVSKIYNVPILSPEDGNSTPLRNVDTPCLHTRPHGFTTQKDFVKDRIVDAYSDNHTLIQWAKCIVG
jgi:hypothetical protein